MGKCMVHPHMQKIVLPDGNWTPGRPGDGTMKEQLDRHYSKQVKEVQPSQSVNIDSLAFLHTIIVSQPEMDEDDMEVMCATQALTYTQAKHNQRKGSDKSDMKGKSVHFNSMEIPSGLCAHPGPASRQVVEVEEIVSATVQALSTKGKAPESVKAITQPTMSTSKSKETPPVASSSSSSSLNTANVANPLSMMPPLNQYRYSYPLEDKNADKCVLEHILNTTISIPIREILAVPPDVRKVFRDQMTIKCITIDTVSVNELSSQPELKDWMHSYDEVRLQSDNGKVIADHYMPLRCIQAMTFGRQVLTCMLD
ncbi:hypothetical protein BDR05DRAFT_1006175 [Suillus weaverae]|nr:hypothetical protein BDR05DRAFT_1006175 [Suillus weaverae]